MTNREIAELLHHVSAAYQILGENRFRIMAYDKAADSIEHLTSELKDKWKQGKLNEVSGVGTTIADHLDELFRTGKSKHFEDTLNKLPASIYPLLLVPGIGPKKANKLVTILKLKDPKTVVADLEKAAHAGKIATIEGFGEKSEEVILSGIDTFKKGQIKENRMVLPDADSIVQEVIAHMRKIPETKRIDTMGSLRRQRETIGDIDIAVATTNPKKVIEHFLKYPHEKLTDQGPQGSTVLLHNGRQVDIRVQRPQAYGAMLQYFTGSKHHNIKLRTLALEKGLSLNEYGIKNLKTGKLEEFSTEEAFYKRVGLPYIPPEMREDRGEIEHAIKGTLPKVLELSDMKGDLHMHANFQFATSHDIGASPLSAHLANAQSLGYDYIGISDHNPSVSTLTEKQCAEIMNKRRAYYQKEHEAYFKTAQGKKGRPVGLFVMCEVDILTDGKLALPDVAFEGVDAVIVSLHSSFTQDEKTMTKRIISALTAHPKVRIFGHPTGRLLTKREGVVANWPEVFAVCKERSIAMEINAYPDRLDLPDGLVYEAREAGVRFSIDTDSHMADQMMLMKYGVSVARRGWATKSDIVNTMTYNDFKKWLTK